MARLSYGTTKAERLQTIHDIQRRQNALVREYARQAVELGGMMIGGELVTKESTIRGYLRRYRRPGETRAATYVQAEQAYARDRALDRLTYKPEDLPTSDYETVKATTPKLVAGVHDSTSFYYVEMLPNEDKLVMSQYQSWAEEYSNISGSTAKYLCAAYVKGYEYDEPTDMYLSTDSINALLADGWSMGDIEDYVNDNK